MGFIKRLLFSVRAFRFLCYFMEIVKKSKIPFPLCGPLHSQVRNRTGGGNEIATGTSRSTRDDHFDRAEDHEEVHDGDDLKREIE